MDIQLKYSYSDVVYTYKTGCPKTVRSDYGTKNCFLAATHIAFRGNRSHVYRSGKSTTNTLLEMRSSNYTCMKCTFHVPGVTIRLGVTLTLL